MGIEGGWSVFGFFGLVFSVLLLGTYAYGLLFYFIFVKVCEGEGRRGDIEFRI